MIILHQDEQEISDQGEAYLALYVDLPEVIGLLCLKALYGLDGRNGHPLQMMLDQHASDGLFVGRQRQQIPDESRVAMRILDLGLDDVGLRLRIDLVIVAVPPVVET